MATTRTDTKVGRFYTLDDGTQVPSVTHVLSVINKPALIPWAANQERALVMDTAADLYLDIAGTPPMGRPAYLATLQTRLGKEKAHRRQMEKATEIGSQAHGLVEWWVRRQLGQAVGPEPKVVDAAQWAFMSFQDWAKSVDLKPLAIEQVVFSRKHEYAGTMDLLADVDGVRTLVDLKTSKAVYAEYFLQVAAYAKALGEMGHGEPARGLILRLPKVETDPAFEPVPVPQFDELFPTFLYARGLWTWFHAQEVAYQEKRKASAA